ncbi:MAG: AI-2E family transporter [Pseudomonadota bacterium]|nr:AI-2E family transporter [Pseudomonadota bacterium]
MTEIIEKGRHGDTGDMASAARVGIVVLAALGVGLAFWALRSILTPLALAVFLLLMIDGLARALASQASWLPKGAALPVAIVIIVAVFAGAIWAVADNAAHFARQAGGYSARLNMLIGEFAGKAGVDAPPTLDDLMADASPARVVGIIAGGLRRGGETAVFVLIYLGFLIAARKGFPEKMHSLFSGAKGLEADRLLERMRSGVESYIWGQTIIAAIIAVASAAIMGLLGLDHWVFWAFVIFLASFIPVIGGAIGVLLPPLFGILQFNDWVRPVVMLVGLELLHIAVGQVLQPRLHGRNLNLDPVVVVLSLAFWSLIWGVAGAFLSIPLTVVCMAVLAEFDSTRWIAVLLSSDGHPYPETPSPMAPAGA